ncbi:MAG: AMP-binding protein [Parachlamydiales bacterium]|nr:AMP-binding protein [Parachlamydiales bacterium]
MERVMRKLVMFLLCFIGRRVLSLRYKVELKGWENLSAEKGVLLLPNHPSLTDPILLVSYLWPRVHLRPLVVEYIYHQAGIVQVMKLFKALPIPNLETSFNEVKLQKTKEAIEAVIRGLKKKDSFLLYPAGRLKPTNKEIIGGASAVHTIVKHVPEVQVYLIRTTGLWGSSFSRAFEGKTPPFKKTLMQNIKNLLANGIFFMPRRKVLIEIEQAPADFPYHETKIHLNSYLEDWYNQYATKEGIVDREPLYLVRYRWWSKKIGSPSIKRKEKRIADVQDFTSSLEEEIFLKISALSDTPLEKITKDLDLSSDLRLDSLDIAELITFLSAHGDIGEVHPEDIVIVQDLLEIAEGRKKRVKREDQVFFMWPEEKKREDPELPNGKTIPEAFLRVCDRMGNAVALGDDLIGVLTYKKMKLTVLALTYSLKKIPGKHIGVLLPATGGTYLVIFALLLAGKVPVMLNWTLGSRYLNHMIELAGVKKVVSSWQFLERVSNIEFGTLSNMLFLLEDMKKEISWKQKIAAFWHARKKTKSLLRELKLSSSSEEDVAVILFTSGTEANPKGVPLSHKNILSNQQSAMQCVALQSNDVFYGMLPPFHSFGFSVAGVLPILAGIKIAFYPDPTDSYALVEGIKRWKVTLLCLAPSFLKGIMQAAKKEELKTVRLFVTGAEKTPKHFFAAIKNLSPKASLIEGYGITECSPILTLNRPDLPLKGVGQLLPGVDFCTIDPETEELLPSGTEGEICVAGPNVFHGYLGKQKSPFLKINGKEWYKTGDLGRIDEEGYVILAGRLKRFVKIGGEMISLGSVEEVLIQEFSPAEDGPSIALSVKEEEGRPSLIVFTTRDMDKNEINKVLQKKGFSRLVKISQVRHIEALPMMGTGKIDYRYLQQIAESE